MMIMSKIENKRLHELYLPLITTTMMTMKRALMIVPSSFQTTLKKRNVESKDRKQTG
jgi:hypothetical protein